MMLMFWLSMFSLSTMVAVVAAPDAASPAWAAILRFFAAAVWVGVALMCLVRAAKIVWMLP